MSSAIRRGEATGSMVLSNISYALREAAQHFRRNWSTCLGAVLTIFLSLFIIGVFVFGSVLINSSVAGVEDKVTIQAFLSDDAVTNRFTEVDSLIAEIKTWDNVESVEYKSKEQALDEYRQTMSNKNAADAVAALDGQNPVPASIVIRMDDPSEVKDMADKLMNYDGFYRVADDPDDIAQSVQYGQGTVEKLFDLADMIRLAAIVLVALLMFVAFVFINNTIRLAITARQREIGIMRLVGASNGFIRGPFVTEGVLEAVLGALLSIAALQVILTVFMPRLANNLQFLSFELPQNVVLLTYGALLLGGMLLGLFGSLIAMGRYLKV